MQFSKEANNSYKLAGAQINVHRLTKPVIRKVIIRSLKYLTNQLNNRVAKGSGLAKAGRANFASAIRLNHPYLWSFLSTYRYSTMLNLHKPLTEYMLRKANNYIKSIFPDVSQVQKLATVDKFSSNINDMLSKVSRSSKNLNVTNLTIDLLVETTYVLVRLL
jgi:hypothetical protein